MNFGAICATNRNAILSLLSLSIATGLALMPARATSEYKYGKDEYVTVRGARAEQAAFAGLARRRRDWRRRLPCLADD